MCLPDGSGVSREVHAPFCERLVGKFRWPTHPLMTEQVYFNRYLTSEVAFKDDDSRIRRGTAAENMSVIRHLALNLIKKEASSQFCVPRKTRKAALYDDYREKLLGR